MGTWNVRPDKRVDLIKIVSEFTVSHSCCGPATNAAYLANALDGEPSIRQLSGVVARDRAAGFSGPGNDAQTIAQLYSDMTHFEGYNSTNTRFYGYKEYYTTDDVAAVSRSLLGSVGAIIVEVGHAYKLPFMEQGVNGHFILLAAYDDTHGSDHFYVCNPDRVPRPGNIYGGDWMSIQEVCAADVCGMIRASR